MINGLAASFTTATSNSDAVAIASGSGSDTITNSATIEAVSTSNADSVGFSLTPTGGVALSANAVWDGGVTANAISGGIRADGLTSRNRKTEIDVLTGDQFITITDESIAGTGDNNVTNNGNISIASNAISPALNIGVAVAGVGVAISTSTANSEAIGIETGAGIDSVTNTHRIHSVADATAVTINASGTGAGVALSGDAFWDGGTSADAESIAIETRGGADTITNTGELDANSVAVSTSVAGTVTVSGVAGSIATSDAIATSIGIDSGGGADTITNDALIDTDAIANADAVAVTLNFYGVSASTPDIWDGGTTSEAFADGINAGDGDDTITNHGRIDTRGVTVSAAASLPFTVGGVAAALSTSTTKSDVNGIDGGAGNDTITNHGELETNARATSVTVTGSIGVLGVALAADALWDGGTSSEAFSDSIAGGGGNDTITNTAGVTTYATSRANSIQVPVSLIGVTVAGSTSTAEARGASIDGENGNDVITNTGALLSDVKAHATSVSVSLAVIGGAGSIDAEWDGGTGSDAKAYGIAGGEGNDTIDNQDRVEARAESDACQCYVASGVGCTAGQT